MTNISPNSGSAGYHVNVGGNRNVNLANVEGNYENLRLARTPMKDSFIYKAFIISLSKIDDMPDSEIARLNRISDQLNSNKLNDFALSYSPITRIYRKIAENLSDDLDSDEEPDEETGELPNDVVEILKSPEPVRAAKKLCEKFNWNF